VTFENLCRERVRAPGLIRHGATHARRWRCKTSRERNWERGSLRAAWRLCCDLRAENRRIHRGGL
jgi:hypothetical protein